MDPARRRATYSDILALPAGVRAEILGGELTTLPAPLPRHARVQRAVARYVGGPFDDDDGIGGPGGWWIFTEVDIALGEDIVRPDLSGWRRSRLPDPDVRPITVVPDWLCEVLSPSNEAHDRVRKRRLYAAHGVGHYWIIDPEARTLEAFMLVGERWQDAGSFDETAVARVPPFEAIDIPVGRLFLPRSPRA
jgi:Uma2 family endonuclease